MVIDNYPVVIDNYPVVIDNYPVVIDYYPVVMFCLWQFGWPQLNAVDHIEMDKYGSRILLVKIL